MTTDELYAYITEHMTPEQALRKLLESSLVQYGKLKFDGEENAVHPVILISMAAMDMGWQIAVASNDGDVKGLAVGTAEYMESVFGKKEASPEPDADDDSDLPDFLYRSDGEIKVGHDGDSVVTDEWARWKREHWVKA